jgi:hypothetical protein
MMTINRKAKHNFENLSGQKISAQYISKFESAVKHFESLLEEEKQRQTMAIRSRFASFN